MDLIQAHDLAWNLLKTHGLNDWIFEFDRAKKRAGACHRNRRMISMSKVHVELNDEEEVKDTILHEIAHALAGRGAGHGPKWKAICRQIGAKPKRCCGKDVKFPKGKYKVVCTGCKEAWHFHRMLKNPSKRHCSKCGPEQGKLKFFIRKGS